MAKNKNAKTYEAPKAEVIIIESQCVLCASGLTTSGTGTTNMAVSSGNTAIVM